MKLNGDFPIGNEHVGAVMKKSLIIFLVLLFPLLAESQTEPAYEDSVLSLLTPLVKNQFGSKYSVYADLFDYLIGAPRRDQLVITDPFGTLRHCVLFYAWDDTTYDSSFVGMYKDGKIIWHCDRIIHGTPHGLFDAEDINKDGTVDLMTTWYDPTTQRSIQSQEMWIFSWDGSSGRIINGIDSSDVNLQSVVSGLDGFVLQDIDGNHVYYISSMNDDEDSTIYFYWNGSRYVDESPPKK